MISVIAKTRCLWTRQDGSRVMRHTGELVLLLAAILTLGNYPVA